MQLKLGKMTSQELSEWFGVKVRSFSNNRERYFDKLKYFANFEPVYGGVVIKEIYVEEYDKGISKDDEFFVQEIEKCVKEQHGLASISGVANIYSFTEEGRTKSFSQNERRMSAAAKRQFGNYGDKKGGLSGMREREWAIKLSDNNEYRRLTNDERELLHKIAEAYYEGKGEDIIEQKRKEKQWLSNEIGETEYKIYLRAQVNNFFDAVIQNFKIASGGHQLVLATKYDLCGKIMDFSDMVI